MRGEKDGYIFEYLKENNELAFYNQSGQKYLKLPASVLLVVDDRVVPLCGFRHEYHSGRLTVFADSPDEGIGRLAFSFQFDGNSVEVTFSAEAKQEIQIHSIEFFRDGRRGMYMTDCIRFFAPAPRNFSGINRAFSKVLCDCSTDAYFAPPPLNFCIGNKSGWIAFGLLDLPNSYEYKMTENLGILVEKPGGKLSVPKGETYYAPRMVITFPESEWDSISCFRAELERRRLLPPKREQIPGWWRKPLVVTYGDQIMELQYNWYSDDDWDSPEFNLAWLEDWLARAERLLGFCDFSVVVDAFWQYRYSAEAKADELRFPALRAFIDRCHARGHRVLLWSAPLIDNPYNGFETLASRFGVLSSDRVEGGILDGKYYIDFTSNQIDAYFDELSRLFFSDDPDALDCDGLKLDFLAFIRRPDGEAHYQNPENGIGIKELYRFYDRFQRAAVRVKPDVCLNGSGCDPRFETVMAMNRLHDIQYVYEEREQRARISKLACPGLLVDSDGAIMCSDWVRETYINAVIYATPSLYYVRQFHDGISFDETEMRALGALLRLSGEKTDGEAYYDGRSGWKLVKDGRVTAESFDGKALFVYNGSDTFYVFSWEAGVLTLPAYDYHFKELPGNFSCTGTQLRGCVEAGRVYRLEIEKLEKGR